MSRVAIVGARIENLRGFRDAYIDLDRQTTILLGQNNEGKSSLLLLIDFLLNTVAKDASLANSDRPLSQEECELIVPANNERHRARRFTLYLTIKDGRIRRKYIDSAENTVQLRMSYQPRNATIRLNCGKPKRGETSGDNRAQNLLTYLSNSIYFALIPAARDADAYRFKSAFNQNLNAHLLELVRYSGHGGTPAEYRKARNILRDIATLVKNATDPFWAGVKPHLPQGLAKRISIDFPKSNESLAKWIENQVSLRITTGEHDCNMVSVGHVGNGLQSLLDVAMTLATNAEQKNKAMYMAIEEPEAFLHPVAQRDISDILRHSLRKNSAMRLLITTHSPIVVDESYYNEVCLVRDRKFFSPSIETSAREEINTALMTNSTGEVFFSNVVLLVEGPGDRVLFEILLRRLRRLDNTEMLSGIHVQETGGKTQFAPWIRLLKSYERNGVYPIRWLCLFDADAASKGGGNGERAAVRALNDAGYTLSSEKAGKLGDLTYDKIADRKREATQLNNECKDLNAHFFNIDLEWAICDGVWWETKQCLEKYIGVLPVDEGEDPKIVYARKLGSKVNSGTVVNKPKKEPYIRAKYASTIPMGALSKQIWDVLIEVVSMRVSVNYSRTLRQRAVSENPQFT